MVFQDQYSTEHAIRYNPLCRQRHREALRRWTRPGRISIARWRGQCAQIERCSFSAETPVATEEGTQAISTLDVGDQVLAWDEATGQTRYYTVTATLVHNDPLMVYLTIVSPELAEGGEIVQTTPEHPFYVVEVRQAHLPGSEWSAYLSVGKWVDAGELQIGDEVRQADGSLGIVSKVNVVVAAQVMYNLIPLQMNLQTLSKILFHKWNQRILQFINLLTR